MDKKGGKSRQLTSNSATDFSPGFSPDGKTIVFYSDLDGNYETYRMTSEGEDQTRLTWNTDASPTLYKEEGPLSTSTFLSLAPAWSPDGKWIAYFCYKKNSAEICVMRPDGSAKTRLTFNDAHDGAPSWRMKPISQ